MARMIPGVMPEFEGQSRAEQHLYEELRRQLSDDYIVFYGVRFLANRDRAYSTDREIDFLIAHPRRSSVVVEVKGGGIRYSPEYDAWASIDRHGTPHQIKNPFEQARTNVYDLMSELGRHRETRPHRYSFNWQVMLPSVSRINDQLGTEAPPETVIDSTDVSDLQAAVERAARPLPERDQLSTRAIRSLIDAIAPTVQAPPDGLGYHLLTSERDLIELTKTQTQLLDMLEHHPRAGIAGCCGSGKTMLALEKARRLAASDQRVLLTCFNANLARWLQGQLASEGFPQGEQILCLHYHELAREICGRTGVEMPAEPEDQSEKRTYFEETFPERLDQAIALLPLEERFDAVIADEGQDFSELWWSTLDSILKEPETGIFYIFYDNNQRIYGTTGDLPVPQNPFSLNRNCRNTDEIHNLVRPYHQGDVAFQAGGVNGREPEFVPVASKDGRTELQRTLHALVNVEGVPERDITVLSPVTERGGSALHDGLKLGNLTLRRTHGDLAPADIRLSTIHSFKGLESPVIVMTELERLEQRRPEFRQLLLYVGLSRARSHLVIIGGLPDEPNEGAAS